VLPKYLKVQYNLQHRIQRGEFKPGDAIPPERELAEHYAVSRITVRRAIQELVAMEQLEAAQGKGTFVKYNHANLDLVPLRSCTEDIEHMGLEPSRRVIESVLLSNEAAPKYFIGQNPSGLIFKLSRVYYGSQDPINYTESFLNYSFFPGLEHCDFSENSLYDVLHQEYGLVLTHARRTIEATFASNDVADYLGVADTTPVLFFRCRTQGIIRGQEFTFEHYSSWYRSDKYAFYIDQTRREKGGDGLDKNIY